MWIEQEKKDVYRTGSVGSRVWNVDETQLQLDHTRTKKSLTLAGHSTPPTRSSLSQTAHISLMPLVNARGEKGPLLILSKEDIAVANDRTMIKLSQNPGWAAQVTENGWNEADVMDKWIENVFLPLVQCRREHTATQLKNTLALSARHLILVDGHSSHMSPKMCAIAAEHNIDVLMYPANMTHLLQALDCAGLANFKLTLSERYRSWQSSSSYSTLRDSGELLKLIVQTYNDDLTEEDIKRGFKNTGTYPWDPARSLSNIAGWGKGVIRRVI